MFETRLADYSRNREALRRYVRMFYDLQRIRIQVGGRSRAGAKNSPAPELWEADIERLKLRELVLRKAERDALHDIEDCLKRFSFYTDVLKRQYRGLGPTMAGVILAEFDIVKAETVSKMWSFAGLNVVVNDEGNGVAPRPKKGEKLRYNAWLRTKMVGVLADCLIKAKSPWSHVYRDYKQRKKDAAWGKSDGHRHNAAKRYMVKMLLIDLWTKWREHEGLPVREPYAVEKLGQHPFRGVG